MKPFPLIVGFLVLAALAQASGPVDLGDGLDYFRVLALPADLPAATPKACVLDLRYTPGETPAAVALAAWLKFHASARTPVFVLANAGTAPVLLSALTGNALPAGTLTLGTPTRHFAPDIVIHTDAETERRAYDAFTAGTPLASLIQENTAKRRFDEAEMLRRQGAGEPLEGEDGDEIPATKPPDPSAPAAPPPLFDATLQRAVQLHRGLNAFGLFKH